MMSVRKYTEEEYRQLLFWNRVGFGIWLFMFLLAVINLDSFVIVVALLGLLFIYWDGKQLLKSEVSPPVETDSSHE